MPKDRKLEDTQDIDVKAVRNAASAKSKGKNVSSKKENSKGGPRKKSASPKRKPASSNQKKKTASATVKKQSSSQNKSKNAGRTTKSSASTSKKPGTTSQSNKIRRFPKEEAQNQNQKKKSSAKKKRTMRKVKGIVLFSLACIVVLALLAGLSISQLFKIKTISVNYTLDKASQSEKLKRKYTDEQVIHASGVDVGNNLIFVKYVKNEKVSQSIVNNLPFLNVESIDSEGMSRLILNVRQIKPTYAFAVGESYVLTDDSLNVVSKTEDSKSAGNYTVIRYANVSSYETGKKIGLDPINGEENAVESLLSAVKAADMKNITDISLKNIDDLYMTYDNRITVHVGDRKDIVSKLKLAAKSLASEDKNSTQQKGELNMTIDNKAYFTSE